jgi:hypothetical protein
MAVTPHDSASTFTFCGTAFTVTNLTVNLSDVSGESDRIDVSHLGQTTGEIIATQARPLVGTGTGETGREISFDYIGANEVTPGGTGSYSITGPVALSGEATILSSTLTLAVNDVVRGNATVRVT